MQTIKVFLKKVFLLEYVLLGFFIAFMVNSSGSCKKESNNQPDTPGVTVVDMDKMDADAAAIEAAFKSGDVNQIKATLTEDALNSFGAALSKVTKTNFMKLGDALKTRTLKVNTDLYAEYEYTKDGTVFTIALARQADGTWKLMRF